MRKSPKKKTKPTAKAPKAKKPAKAAARPVREEPTFDQIRQRAYEIYVRRGGTPGSDIEDWISAERELRGA